MAGGPEGSTRAGPSNSKKRPVSSITSRDTRSKRARTRGTQELTMTTNILRPKTKRKRSVKGKEKATSSDEDEHEIEPAASNDEAQEVVDEDIQNNSASQSSSTVSSPSDGKSSSATSLEPVETALARAHKELASKNEVLKKQTATLNALQGVLQCQICLELLWRPYSLTPCGHVACEVCLVAWFSQPGELEQQLEMPLLVPSMKKKTCPTCRTEVRARPVVAYLIKSALDAVLPCLDPSTYDKMSSAARVHDDPFKELFPPDYTGSAGRHRNNIMDAYPDVIIDHEDGGVPRCPRCVHEIFDGVCTGCGRLYDGISEEEGLDDLDSDDGGIYSIRDPGSPPIVTHGAGWRYSDDEHLEGDDDPYESDFIDDGPLHFPAFSDDSLPEGQQRYARRASTTSPGASRSRPRVAVTPSDDEHSSDTSDADNWESYLGRTARRHGSDDSIRPIVPARRAAATGTAVQNAVNVSDGESDWATRPRHERLAAEERAARRVGHQGSPIVPDEDEEDDPRQVPHYVSVSEDEDDVIRPPWAFRRGLRRVVNVHDNDEEDSADDVFEDAVSSAAATATSAGRQSSRYQSGASRPVSDSEGEEIVQPTRSVSHLRHVWNDEDETEVDGPAHWSGDPELDGSDIDEDRTDDSGSDDHSDVSSEDSF